jgi:leader peptidase (prepilin peptidase)/N-methyltransferase
MPAGSSMTTLAPARDGRPARSAGIAAAVGLAVLATTLVAAAALGPLGVALGATLAILVPAAVSDVRHGTLPDRLVLPAGVTGVITGMICVVTHGWQPAGAAVGGAAALAAPVLALHAVDPDSMGFGDVKLAAALGIAVGLVEWRLAIVVLLVAATLGIAHAAGGRRRSAPFGAALVAATAIVIVAASAAHLGGDPVLGWELAAWR